MEKHNVYIIAMQNMPKWASFANCYITAEHINDGFSDWKCIELSALILWVFNELSKWWGTVPTCCSYIRTQTDPETYLCGAVVTDKIYTYYTVYTSISVKPHIYIFIYLNFLSILYNHPELYIYICIQSCMHICKCIYIYIYVTIEYITIKYITI